MCSVTYRRQEDLGDLMQSRHAMGIILWIPTCFSPISSDPHLLHHQLFGFVLIRFPCFCLHSLPSSPGPSQTPHLLMFRMQLQVLKQRTGFFAICPQQPFQLVPTSIWYLAVLALWGSFLTSVCLYILGLCPRARELCAKT